MGNRRKFLFKEGTLFDALTGEILRSWIPVSETISHPDYSIQWQTREGKEYFLHEDEEGVILKVEGTQTFLTRSPIHLPDFKESGHPQLLRSLLHEVLINVVDGKPLTNFLVHTNPSYRDAAIICECLERTGNLHLVREWIASLREPFDYLDAGSREPDNIGQALFLVSLVGDKEHPLVSKALEAVEPFRKTDYIEGPTDSAQHPVYQTKWLKFGLRCLGLPDPYKIPVAFDPYSSVFWMDFRDIPNNGPPFSEKTKEALPYLAWAEAHFHGWDPPMPIAPKAYPLSWEVRSGWGGAQGMALVAKDFAEKEIVTPQARHAAEMILYFLDRAAGNITDRHDRHAQFMH